MLTRRRQKVLMALIDEYVVSAAPVGSTRIAERYLQEVSAATVRNELMELVALGYAASPHTSAGRIPTDSGYRAFVNSILLKSDLNYLYRSGNTKKLVQYKQYVRDREQHIMQLLSDIAQSTGLLAMYLADKPQATLYYRGLPQLLMQPEFQKALSLMPLMQLIEDESHMYNLLLPSIRGGGLTVRVGFDELGVNLCEYSVVTYVVHTLHASSVLAVFGPTRMDYRKVIDTVYLAACSLARF